MNDKIRKKNPNDNSIYDEKINKLNATELISDTVSSDEEEEEPLACSAMNLKMKITSGDGNNRLKNNYSLHREKMLPVSGTDDSNMGNEKKINSNKSSEKTKNNDFISDGVANDTKLNDVDNRSILFWESKGIGEKNQ